MCYCVTTRGRRDESERRDGRAVLKNACVDVPPNLSFSLATTVCCVQGTYVRR